MRTILRTHALVKEEDLARTYADLFGLPFIETITEKMADPELLSRIPLKFLREHVVIPIWYQDHPTIVTANPGDFQPLDELTLLLGSDTSNKSRLKPWSLSSRLSIGIIPLEGTKQMIEELEEEKEMEDVDFGAIQEEDILGMASEAPIIKLVNHILYQAVKRDASDIHIEPFEKDYVFVIVSMGCCIQHSFQPKRAQAALTSRIKIMANMNIAEKRYTTRWSYSD